MQSGSDFDITKNIRAVEMLKSRLLTAVADLYEDLRGESKLQERPERLADILIVTYLLSNRLGIGSRLVDQKALNKLKLGLLEEESGLREDLAALYKHLNRPIQEG